VVGYQPRDSVETFFRANGIPLLPYDVHDALLWAILPKAAPYRDYVVESFADGYVRADQKRAVLAFLGWQARGYLDRGRADQAQVVADFARSLADSAGIHEDEAAFVSMAQRARGGNGQLQADE
jgi:hypothetical protein